MKQSKLDSFMEALVNVVIGLIVSTIANHFLLPAVLGVQMSIAQNIVIGLAFTVISIMRSYVLRRLFNGRSVWVAVSSGVRRLWCFWRHRSHSYTNHGYNVRCHCGVWWK